MAGSSETPEQRQARYLRLSAEAEATARYCGADLREAYMALSRSWALLAKDVNAGSDKEL